MFAALFAFLLTGFPVAFVLGGVSILFAIIGAFTGSFHLGDFGFLPARIFGVMSNITLMAVPLFIFMGMMLERSGLSDDLLKGMERAFGSLKGGLALAVIFVGMLLAATTGIVGATVVTMGVLSLPTMLARGYSKELATGVIATSGTLGQIIPPSVVLVLLGDLMNLDVGDLFMGAVIPGLLLVLAYALYVIIRVQLNPALAPLPPKADASNHDQENFSGVFLQTLLPTAGMILVVLGSIFFGFASPTEAAACGGVAALAIALLKRRFSIATLKGVSQETVQSTAMVFMILIGAQFFGVVFRGLEGDRILERWIQEANLPPYLVLLATHLLIFGLGFFIDFFEICFIVLPIVVPILLNLEYDALWLAITFAINLQTSFLTPPFGFALFYLKGVTPPEIKSVHIYRGVIPFILVQLLVLGLLVAVPALSTWLPKALE